MKYTTEEKILIAQSHPEIEIEGIDFEYTSAYSEDDSPMEELCIMTEDVEKIYCLEQVEGIYATFHFRDKGAKFGKKLVFFNDFAQIYDDSSDEIVDYSCEIMPKIAYPATADDEGRFTVSVPIFIRKVDEDREEEETLVRDLCKDEALFNFGEIVVGNQFACEKINYVTGVISEHVEESGISIMCTDYDLTSNHVAEDEEQ